MYLSAKLESVGGGTVRTELVRNGESMWSGKAYHGEMQGCVDTYPILDLSKFEWDCPEAVPFSSVRNGRLLGNMQNQLDHALAALPFRMAPIDDKVPWQEGLFSEGPSAEHRAYFKLYREDVPKWIIGLEKLRMSGSWEVFFPNPSPERALVEQLMSYEYEAAKLARKQTARTVSLEAEVASVDALRTSIQDKLGTTAA